MCEDNNNEEVIDLGTNVEFVVVYKTIRCANGKTYTIEQKEVIEPELPKKRANFKRGRGRPKKVQE